MNRQEEKGSVGGGGRRRVEIGLEKLGERERCTTLFIGLCIYFYLLISSQHPPFFRSIVTLANRFIALNPPLVLY